MRPESGGYVGLTAISTSTKPEPEPMNSPLVIAVFITTSRSAHAAAVHHGQHRPGTDRSGLSALIGASVALVAVIGGLRVAKFVAMDSDERTSRKVVEDAAARLQAAQNRAAAA
jgi:hypothetical protein